MVLDPPDLTAIRLLLLDVDGVLTDGRMVFDAQGEALKLSHAHDGHRIRLAQERGLRIGLLSGRDSGALRRRAADLGLDPCLLGVVRKRDALVAQLAADGLAPQQVGYIGDDLPDAELLGRVGWFVAVADAHPSLRARADEVLRRPGGNGAVAEAIELLLRRRGQWGPVAIGKHG
jgi:3-deoxy-D-manno-octulosonate 8-phosphate phosphatase (KDO 8-P phosphatase)